MIALLTGLVDSLSDGTCVIDVGGVGYLVHASSRTLSALPQLCLPSKRDTAIILVDEVDQLPLDRILAFCKLLDDASDYADSDRGKTAKLRQAL